MHISGIKVIVVYQTFSVYRGMFEIQSPENMTSSGENVLNIRTNANTKWETSRFNWW